MAPSAYEYPADCGTYESAKTLLKHSVHPPPPPFCRGGWASNQVFKKRGRDRTSTFRGGLLGKRGWLFTQGGRGEVCNFHIKNKLKFEIFNDKKSFYAKIFFSVITKNSNWEILPKNLLWKDKMVLRMENFNILGFYRKIRISMGRGVYEKPI